VAWLGACHRFLLVGEKKMFGYNNNAFNHSALRRTQFTPDISELELHQFVLLFVCDDVMRAGKNYKLIAEHSAKAARGFTMKAFNFYSKRTDGMGIPMKVDAQPDRFSFTALKIKGEIHAVRPAAFPDLDRWYQNGQMFRRVRTKILYPTREHGMIVNKDSMGRKLPVALQGAKHFLLPEKVEPIEAWMYVGVPNYWNPLLDGGYEFETVPIRYPKEDRSWLVKYYHYQNPPLKR